jgi:hypothetical protein
MKSLNWILRLVPILPKEQAQNPVAEGWLQGQPDQGIQTHDYPWLYEVPDEFAGKIKEAHITGLVSEAGSAWGVRTRAIPLVPEGNIRHMGKIASETMATV